MSVVVIDPGHGGRDPGAVYNGMREADITLAVALRIQYYLSKLLPDKVCVLTRTKQTDDVPTARLAERVAYANQLRAQCFVSVHCNASTSDTANGAETWYFTGSEPGKRLASAVHTSYINALGFTDRGLRETSRLYVLRHTKMPACLIELGFLSNPAEAEYMKTEEFQATAARAIADGIRNFVLREVSSH